MANANSTEISLTTEQLNDALMKISRMAITVRQLSISAIVAGENIEERDSFMSAIEHIAGQIGWVSDTCAIKFGGVGIAGGDAGYWILDSNFYAHGNRVEITEEVNHG